MQKQYKHNIIMLSFPEGFINTNSKIEDDDLDSIMFGSTTHKFIQYKTDGTNVEMFYLNDIKINKLGEPSFNEKGYKEEGNLKKTFRNLAAKLFRKQITGDISLYDLYQRSIKHNPSSETVHLFYEDKDIGNVNLKDYKVNFIRYQSEASAIIIGKCHNMLESDEPLKISLHGHGSNMNLNPDDIHLGGKKFKDIIPVVRNIISRSNAEEIEIELESCYGANYNPAFGMSPAEIMLNLLEKEFPNKRIKIVAPWNTRDEMTYKGKDETNGEQVIFSGILGHTNYFTHEVFKDFEGKTISHVSENWKTIAETTEKPKVFTSKNFNNIERAK